MQAELKGLHACLNLILSVTFVTMSTRKALLFIFITIMIDSTGLGIIIPSLPSLVADTAHVSLEQSTSYYAIILGVYALMQFLFSPIIGGLSDRFGRRPVLLLSMLGLGVDYIFMYFAPDLWWLILGRCISGALGASYTTAMAYIADVSPPEDKTKNFGIVGAAFGVGFVVGPAIGGLLGDLDIRSPFLFAAGLSLLNLLYGMFVLKESLPVEKRRAFNPLRSNVFGALVQIVNYKAFALLFVVIFLYYLAGMAIHSTWVYYTQEKFGWSRTDVGISLAVVGVCVAAIQGGLAGFFSKRFGEIRTVYISMAFFVVSLVAIAAAGEGWMLYALMVPYAFTGLAGPAIQSIMSNSTAEDAQGELQGTITSILSISEIFGPYAMMWIFALTTVHVAPADRIYGSPYYLAAILVVLSTALFVVSVRRQRKKRGSI